MLAAFLATVKVSRIGEKTPQSDLKKPGRYQVRRDRDSAEFGSVGEQEPKTGGKPVSERIVSTQSPQAKITRAQDVNRLDE
jgi:hypothetical protein